MSDRLPCPCQCGRHITQEQFGYADDGVEIAWATRILDIATQYDDSRHPLATSGDRWMTRFLLAAHGNPNAARQLPDSQEVDSWFEAVQAITRTQRTAVIRSRFQPSPRPHTPNQRTAAPPPADKARSMFAPAEEAQPNRWVHVGTEDKTATAPLDDIDDEEDGDTPVELPSISEFLSNDLSVDSAKRYWAMLPAEKRRNILIGVAAVVVFLLVFFIL